MRRFSSNTGLCKLRKEKNSLGRGLNYGAGGKFRPLGPRAVFLVPLNLILTYALFGRAVCELLLLPQAIVGVAMTSPPSNTIPPKKMRLDTRVKHLFAIT